MPESVLDSPNVAERSSAKALKAPLRRDLPKPFIPFRPQAQFDKVAAYLGLIRNCRRRWSLVALQRRRYPQVAGTIKS